MMKRWHVEVGGPIYTVEASEIDTAAHRALAQALNEKGPSVRRDARGPTGLSVTIWERSDATAAPSRDGGAIAGREEE